MRFWRAERGNGLAYGVLATALMILVVGALYDVYAAYHYRTWGYQAAGEAAVAPGRWLARDWITPPAQSASMPQSRARRRSSSSWLRWCARASPPTATTSR